MLLRGRLRHRVSLRSPSNLVEPELHLRCYRRQRRHRPGVRLRRDLHVRERGDRPLRRCKRLVGWPVTKGTRAPRPAPPQRVGSAGGCRGWFVLDNQRPFGSPGLTGAPEVPARDLLEPVDVEGWFQPNFFNQPCVLKCDERVGPGRCPPDQACQLPVEGETGELSGETGSYLSQQVGGAANV